MEYVTGWYRQQGVNASSLLLQQYMCGPMPLCFGCIASGEGKNGAKAGGYLTGRMIGWCRGFPWMSMAKKEEKYFSRASGELPDMIWQSERELQNAGILGRGQEMNLAGVLCAGERILLFGQGKRRICLLNSSYGKGHLQELSGTGEGMYPWIFQGSIQVNAGLLLASETFGRDLPKEIIRDVLNVNETRTREQTETRLRELGREGEHRGGFDMAALLLFVRRKGV